MEPSRAYNTGKDSASTNTVIQICLAVDQNTFWISNDLNHSRQLTSSSRPQNLTMHKISCAPERNEMHGIFDTLSDIVSFSGLNLCTTVSSFKNYMAHKNRQASYQFQCWPCIHSKLGGLDLWGREMQQNSQR